MAPYQSPWLKNLAALQHPRQRSQTPPINFENSPASPTIQRHPHQSVDNLSAWPARTAYRREHGPRSEPPRDATFAKKLSTPRERKPSMPAPMAMAQMRSTAAARWSPDATARQDLQKVNTDTVNEALTGLEKRPSLQTRGAKELDAQCRRPASSWATLPVQRRKRLALGVGSDMNGCHIVRRLKSATRRSRTGIAVVDYCDAL
ncbi:hypothetical protein GGF50DRAFT_89381 [Schizophyllum commune]